MLGKTTGASLAIAIAALLVTSSARAEGEASEEETAALQPNVERRWYGDQTLIADAVSLGFVGVGFAADESSTSSVLVSTGLLSYAFAAPIVHAAHGHAGKAVGDFGMRFALLSVGALVGGAIAADSYTPPPADGTLGPAISEALVEPFVILQGIAIGAATGAVLATTLDAALIAREDVKKPGHVLRQPTARAIVPTVAPTRDGLSAGLAGTF